MKNQAAGIRRRQCEDWKKGKIQPVPGKDSIVVPRENDKDLIYQRTMENLVYAVRDTNLKEVCAKKYQPKQVLREKGFVEATYLVGGMVTKDRYAIVSNHMHYQESYSPGVEGYYYCQTDSHYLCMDIYEYEGKKQILLLHLPETQNWKLFLDFDDQLYPGTGEIINRARKKFEETCLEAPILEANTPKWLRQCSFPVGMTVRGELFPLEDAPLF